MRVTSKGQVTIPIEIREWLGLLPNSEVEFLVEGNAVRIRKARRRKGSGRGRSIVERMRGRATTRLGTGRDPVSHERRLMRVLVDSTVLRDVSTEDARWGDGPRRLSPSRRSRSTRHRSSTPRCRSDSCASIRAHRRAGSRPAAAVVPSARAAKGGCVSGREELSRLPEARPSTLVASPRLLHRRARGGRRTPPADA